MRQLIARGVRAICRQACMGLLVVGALACAVPMAQAQSPIKLRLFAGGANQRPDLVRKLLDEYQKQRPQVRIEIETGGSTSDLQRQYLSTVLNARDPSIDIYLIDIVNPAQYLGAGWLEPLNAHLGEPATVLAAQLPVYGQSNVVNGQLAALPGYADAMFLYYRKDLLARHGLPEPRTWDELATTARRIQQAEGQPQLQGLSLQGAPIEGTVCTFLLPYWSQGKSLQDAQGRLTLDRPAAVKGLRQWLSMVDAGVIKRNVAEVRTGDTVNEFKAGQAIFAVNWSWAWDRFGRDADSRVKGKVGVMPLPAMADGQAVTCVGGWQWAVSAFSRHKSEAARVVQYLSGLDASRFLAIHGALLPTYQPLYQDPDVLRAVPWFAEVGSVMTAGRSRPISPDYAQVSDAIRNTTSAVLARTKTPEEGVAQIQSRLARVLR
ncbi:MAG: ABC transporter substrate-binding protein [Burkholderiales bacterium]|nr:ABC transporter substrate-binding protein [Burkholderiales bacterium]